MDNPIVQRVGAAAQEVLKARVESFDADFTGYDWNSLASTIVQEPTDGWWQITLERFAYVDGQGNFIKEEDAPTLPGAQPAFFLNCEHKSIIRLMEQVYGLPNSETVLRFIKRAMVTPMPGLSPGLPRLLQITIKLSHHRDVIAPFLDSLPAPFEWLIETPQLASAVGDMLDQRMQGKYASFMGAAEIAKTEGNRAFNAKEFKTAIDEYTKAIDRAWDAASSRQGTEDRKIAHRFMAVCYANRAAVYLLPGDESDVKKALEDCQNAERYNPDYAKGYYRQAKAHEALGDIQQAQETLRRALSRPELATDKTLLSLLNELDVQLD
ncbi:hypothetical protein BDY19DRAFT_890733 [Irpex rosettiformis]|uniref:Uncharacterized protein n=1 Tax=Irpex rosettiformis TaxID=378272 RepID=A0ACB8U2W2_9APHY|nr:hypothetical protein BDY19DRAFT_890733 [Irpex rosettiformis]